MFRIITLIFLILLSSQCLASSIAIVKSRDIEPYNQAVEGIRETLTSAGVKSIINCYTLEDEIDEIRVANPAIVIAVGTEAAKICRDSFKTKPVIFTMVLDPSSTGLDRLAGVALAIPLDIQFKKLKETVPSIKTVGMLYDVNTRKERVRDIGETARKLNLVLIAKPVGSFRDIPESLNNVIKESDALWAEVDNLVYTPETAQEIILAAFRGKVPFMAFSSHYVKAGALLALVCDYYDIGRQTGDIAIDILKGEKPGDIGITAPRKMCLVINKHTAEVIGINIPQDILNSADKVFPLKDEN